MRSGDDVRGQLILDEANSVAQVQFPLFEALNLQDVGAGAAHQGIDGGVEVAVLLPEPRQGLVKLAPLVLRHPVIPSHAHFGGFNPDSLSAARPAPSSRTATLPKHAESDLNGRGFQ